MADPKARNGGLAELTGTIKSILSRLRTLEAATGTQTGNLLERVNQALLNLNQAVQDAIAANSYTKDTIDTKLAGKSNTNHTHPASDITSGGTTGSGFTVGGNLGVNGNVSPTGAVSAGGAVSGTTGTFNSGVRSTGVYNNTLSTAYRAQYVDSTGAMGYVPSTRASKNIIKPYLADYTKLLALQPYWAAYKSDLAQTQFATFIAEEMAVNFPEYTFTDEAGNLAGIRYEMFVVALHSAVSQAAANSAADRAQLNSRIAAIETSAATRALQTWTTGSMTALGLNSEKTYTVTWGRAFADTNYVVVPSVSSGGLALAAIANEVPGTRTATSVNVSVRTLGVALLANSTLTVTGLHM